jgi:hypothetical protein
MLYGICGPSSSGKTTLARQIAEDLGMDFYATNTNDVCRAVGIDPHAPMTLDTRLKLQMHIVQHHIEQIQILPRPLITDRTPLDMLAFLAAEFHMQSHLLADEETLECADMLAEACIDATAAHYDMLFYLGPLPTLTVDPTKPRPPVNRIYQRHFALIVQGALLELDGHLAFCKVEATDFEERREILHDTIVERIDEIEKMRQSSALH